ncbi:MAG: hypothetical protein WCP74_11620 [Sphingobacteriia bacterium]|jgi:hypothetical protein
MKRFFFISIIILLFSCNNQSKEDKLALRLSQSKSFIELMQSSLKMADEIKVAKKDTSLMNKYKDLDSISRRDSLLKHLYHSDVFVNYSLKMAESSKQVNFEFPELQKLPKDTKSKVWRKAASIFMANQPIK